MKCTIMRLDVLNQSTMSYTGISVGEWTSSGFEHIDPVLILNKTIVSSKRPSVAKDAYMPLPFMHLALIHVSSRAMAGNLLRLTS